MNLVFATNNKNKLEEVKVMLPKTIELLSLNDINCLEDIPETSKTIQGNASQKTHYVFDKYNLNCFSDDTGLEIEALNGEPGVYSARYAGEQRNSEDNMNLVLEKLKNKTNRKARFKTVISLIINEKEMLFEGIVNGQITTEKSGEKGFGYDPIFIPEGYNKTFAELPLNIKNEISHRGKAIKQLFEYLNK